MSLSPEQLARRLEGITATDVAAIVGVHPYRSRIDIWQEKRGAAPPWVDNDRSKWGELLEPVIRADYAERHGVRVEVPGTLQHPEAPWMMSTPDGVVYQIAGANPERGLEIKCHTFRVSHLYGAPGSDEVPLHELCQCSWNLAVTGLDRWDLVAFIDGQPADYVIDRDEETIEALIDQAHRFHVDCIVGGAVPEPDGSDSFDTWLKGRWSKTAGGLVDIGEDMDTFTLIERGKEIRENQAEQERELAKLVQAMKLKIGDAEGLTWKNAKGVPEKITWKHNKPSKRIDYTGIANDARADARLAVSGHAATIERALVCLKSAGYSAIGSSVRHAINAHELAELVGALRDTLDGIARRTDAGYTTEIPGNRPFCWPRNWKAPTDKEHK